MEDLPLGNNHDAGDFSDRSSISFPVKSGGTAKLWSMQGILMLIRKNQKNIDKRLKGASINYLDMEEG